VPENKSSSARKPPVTSDGDARDLLAVQKTLQGHPQAFAELVERYTPLLFSLSYRMLGSREEAEDAVQEIFLRAFGSLHRFRLASRFYTWLYTIALNWLRSRLRRIRTHERRELFPLANCPEVTSGNPQPEPADRLAAREAERLLRIAIGALPPRYRSVFVLRHAQDLSIAEIAAVLKLPEGTVKTRLFRARQRLQAQIFPGGRYET
jgi:RNA polymerase sigma-70 factor (ECF subfamily)